MEIKSYFTEVNGYRVHYLKSGKGRTLILFHASFSNSESYKGLIEYLAGNFTVYIPDFPGFGSTDSVNYRLKKYMFAEANKIIVEWIRQMRFEKFILAGISLGGLNILQALPKLDEKVNAYLLIQPYAGTKSLKMKRSDLIKFRFLSGLLFNLVPKSLGDKIWNSDRLMQLLLNIVDRDGDRHRDLEERIRILRTSDFTTFFYILNLILTLKRLPVFYKTRKPAILIMDRDDDGLDFEVTRKTYRKYFKNMKELPVVITNHYPTDPLTFSFFKTHFPTLLEDLKRMLA